MVKFRVFFFWRARGLERSYSGALKIPLVGLDQGVAIPYTDVCRLLRLGRYRLHQNQADYDSMPCCALQQKACNSLLKSRNPVMSEPKINRCISCVPL